MNEAQYIKHIGQNIKRLRKARNLSQVQFADMCDREKTFINRIEAGTTNSTIKTYVLIAKALQVEPIELFK